MPRNQPKPWFYPGLDRAWIFLKKKANQVHGYKYNCTETS